MMRTFIALLQLSRAGNLLIMLATLALSYYCLTDYLTPDDLLKPRFVALCVCVILTGAAGYIINDYLDVKIDLTNKPDKVIIGKVIPRRWAMLLHFTFNGIAICLGVYLKWSIGFGIAICTVLLWLYSVVFKRQFLTGNILVAALSAFVIVILPLFDHHISNYLVWSYAFFAFGITLLREIVKDAEDLRGDSKFHCKTLPIVLGIRKTRSILLVMVGVYVLLISMHMLSGQTFIPFRHTYGAIVYLLYMIFMVLIPLLYTALLIYRADVKADFTRLSAWYKFIMITGLLSMVMIKI